MTLVPKAQEPLFSICIPTYSRPTILLEAIDSARSQSYSNIEIIVVDNASPQDVRQVVEAIDDSRIRFFRNDSNIGPFANFRRCLDFARGEYMSWLQDDDAIFSTFCERAVRELSAHRADAYFETAIYSPSLSMHSWESLFAPPLPLDWIRGTCRELTPDLAIPLSLFVTLGMPPLAAYRRENILPRVNLFLKDDFVLFAERVFLAVMAVDGKALLSPHVGGVFRNHAQQFHKKERARFEEEVRQLVAAARELDRMAARSGITMQGFSEVVAFQPVARAREWRAMYPAGPQYPPLASKALQILDERIRADATGAVVPEPRQRRSVKDVATRIAHELLPPVVTRGLRRLMHHSPD